MDMQQQQQHQTASHEYDGNVPPTTSAPMHDASNSVAAAGPSRSSPSSSFSSSSSSPRGSNSSPRRLSYPAPAGGVAGSMPLDASRVRYSPPPRPRSRQHRQQRRLSSSSETGGCSPSSSSPRGHDDDDDHRRIAGEQGDAHVSTDEAEAAQLQGRVRRRSYGRGGAAASPSPSSSTPPSTSPGSPTFDSPQHHHHHHVATAAAARRARSRSPAATRASSSSLAFDPSAREHYGLGRRMSSAAGDGSTVAGGGDTAAAAGATMHGSSAMHVVRSRDRECSTPYPFDDGSLLAGGGGLGSVPGSAEVGGSEGEGSSSSAGGGGRRPRAFGGAGRSGLGAGQLVYTNDDDDDEEEEEGGPRPVFTRATSVASSWKTSAAAAAATATATDAALSARLPVDSDGDDQDMEVRHLQAGAGGHPLYEVADGSGADPSLEGAPSLDAAFDGSAVDFDPSAPHHSHFDGLPPAGTRPRSKRRASSGLSQTAAGGGGRSGSHGGRGRLADGSRSAAAALTSAGWSGGGGGGATSGFLPGVGMDGRMTAGSNAGTPGLPVSGASRMAQAALKGRNKGKSSSSTAASATAAMTDKEDVMMDVVNGSVVGATSALGLESGVADDATLRLPHPLSSTALASRGYTSHALFNRPFHLEDRWNNLRELGQGAYGLVVSAQDSVSGETIAIKLLTRVFDKLILAKRCLREVTLLRHLNGHENITGLIDLDVVIDDFNEIYMFMEPMEADLHQIIRSGQSLTNSHIQYFLYQILRGMKYIHSANIIHRDLKPGNLLVNADCELKICDFGLARGFRPEPSEWDPNSMAPGGALTEYVATRWYRAPEIMLSYKRYSTAIDVWSIGCILAELLGGKPIFKGKDYIDQLNLILGILGTPEDETLQRIASERAGAYLRSLPFSKGVNLESLYPDADPLAIDLLKQMLTFDPAKRISVKDALRHPYMATYHDETDEPDCPSLFDKWEDVENIQTMDEFRHAIRREVDEFRMEVRTVEDDWPTSDGVETDGDSQAETTSDGRLRSPADLPESLISPHSAPTSLPAMSSSSGAVPPPRAPSAHTSPAKDAMASVVSSVASTPRSGISELSQDSVGPPVSASVSHGSLMGRRSRASSGAGNALGDPFVRRPSSMFAGFGGLGSMGFTPMDAAKDASSSAAHGGHGHVSRSSISSTGTGVGADWASKHHKSRTSSSSSIAVARPLVRALSTLSVVDLQPGGKDLNTDAPPPMSVSPSDAPPSEAPLTFGSRKTRKSPAPTDA